MFSASTTYEKQLRIEKTRLSHQVWSHGGSTFFKKKRTLNGHFSRPAETDPYAFSYNWLSSSAIFTLLEQFLYSLKVPGFAWSALMDKINGHIGVIT